MNDARKDKSNVLHLVPEIQSTDAEPSTDEVTWGDLEFIAERLMRQVLDKIDWSDLKPGAELLVDETDAATVIKLMKQAHIEIYVS